MKNVKKEFTKNIFFNKKNVKIFNFENFRFDISNTFFENISKINPNENFRTVVPKDIFFGGTPKALSVNISFVNLETGIVEFVFNKINGNIKVLNGENIFFEIKNGTFNSSKTDNPFYGESFCDLILSLKILQKLNDLENSLSGYFFDIHFSSLIHFLENDLSHFKKGKLVSRNQLLSNAILNLFAFKNLEKNDFVFDSDKNKKVFKFGVHTLSFDNVFVREHSLMFSVLIDGHTEFYFIVEKDLFSVFENNKIIFNQVKDNGCLNDLSRSSFENVLTMIIESVSRLTCTEFYSVFFNTKPFDTSFSRRFL